MLTALKNVLSRNLPQAADHSLRVIVLTCKQRKRIYKRVTRSVQVIKCEIS